MYGPAANDPNMRSRAIGLQLFGTALRRAASMPPPVPAYDPSALEAILRRVAHGKKMLFVERVDASEGAEIFDAVVLWTIGR